MPNNLEKGSTISVESIRKIKDIRLIKQTLKDKPRDLAIFTLGINTNLRASDILKIKVHQVIEAKPGDELVLNEQKTGKPRRITLNKMVINAIRRLLKHMRDTGTIELEGALFKG